MKKSNKSYKREYSFAVSVLWFAFAIKVFFYSEGVEEMAELGNQLGDLAPWMLGPAFATFNFHHWTTR